jgi:hypothetical protein
MLVIIFMPLYSLYLQFIMFVNYQCSHHVTRSNAHVPINHHLLALDNHNRYSTSQTTAAHAKKILGAPPL